jgi:hypothetical protein
VNRRIGNSGTRVRYQVRNNNTATEFTYLVASQQRRACAIYGGRVVQQSVAPRAGVQVVSGIHRFGCLRCSGHGETVIRAPDFSGSYLAKAGDVVRCMGLDGHWDKSQ